MTLLLRGVFFLAFVGFALGCGRDPSERDRVGSGGARKDGFIFHPDGFSYLVLSEGDKVPLRRSDTVQATISTVGRRGIVGQGATYKGSPDGTGSSVLSKALTMVGKGGRIQIYAKIDTDLSRYCTPDLGESEVLLEIAIQDSRFDNQDFPRVAKQKITSYVVDQARVLDIEFKEELEDDLKKWDANNEGQLVVATFKTLPKGVGLEEFATRVSNTWAVGERDKDNGVVLFIFTESRLVRISVGFGLEGVLTPKVSRGIIDDRIVPAFREGKIEAGIAAGVEDIKRLLGGAHKVD